MNHDANMPTPRRPGLKQWLMSMLHVVAGAAPQDLVQLDQRASMQYATLGLAFLLNLVILLAAWIKVGVAYFGAVGVLVPGTVVPCLFVLGLDRLVAMRGRRLTGELAGFNLQDVQRRSREPVLRLAMAVALSGLTTFTFLLTLSTDSIRQRQNEDARVTNQPLRQELTERVQASYSQRTAQIQAREQRLQQERAAQQTQAEVIVQDLAQVETRARQSRDYAAMEAGGLDNRLTGTGPRFRAQMQLALQNDQAAATLRMQLRQAEGRRQAAEKELVDSSAAAATALADRNRGLVNLDEDIRLDDRYVAPRRGLFADATAFVRLYSDPQEALGRWLLTLLTASVLFTLECAALLALALNPSSPLDVLRMARHREQAARVVAESETLIARARAAGAPITAHEAPDAAAYRNAQARPA